MSNKFGASSLSCSPSAAIAAPSTVTSSCYPSTMAPPSLLTADGCVNRSSSYRHQNNDDNDCNCDYEEDEDGEDDEHQSESDDEDDDDIDEKSKLKESVPSEQYCHSSNCPSSSSSAYKSSNLYSHSHHHPTYHQPYTNCPSTVPKSTTGGGGVGIATNFTAIKNPRIASIDTSAACNMNRNESSRNKPDSYNVMMLDGSECVELGNGNNICESPLTPDFVPTPPPPPNCSKLTGSKFIDLMGVDPPMVGSLARSSLAASINSKTRNRGGRKQHRSGRRTNRCQCSYHTHHAHSHSHHQSQSEYYQQHHQHQQQQTAQLNPALPPIPGSKHSHQNRRFRFSFSHSATSSTNHTPKQTQSQASSNQSPSSPSSFASSSTNITTTAANLADQPTVFTAQPITTTCSRCSLSSDTSNSATGQSPLSMLCCCSKNHPNSTPSTPAIPPKINGGLKSEKLKNLIHPLDRSIVGIFTLTIFFTILAIVTGAPTVLFLFLLLPFVYLLKRLCLCQCMFMSLPNHEPVSSIDSFWLNSGHITHCLLYVDKGLSVQQLRDVIATRLLTKPELARFKSKLIFKGLCNSPYWKYEPDYDQIDEHVFEDEPIQSKRCLRQRLVSMMSESLPMEKPLWEIRYAMATYCNQVVLIVRIHQTLSQSGLIPILTHYLSDSVPVIRPVKPHFGGATLSINIFRAIIVGPLTFFLWILWAFTRRSHNYLTKSKRIRSVHWMTLDLPRVYRIKQVTRSTLNDVLLSSIAGSIRAYLTTRTNITNPPDLTVSIPIDIRTVHSKQNNLIGVNYVLTTSPIPTNTEGAIPRLWEVRHLMEELKTSADTAVMYGAHYLLNRLLPRALYRMLVNLVNRNSSIYVSNIQGPESSLSIGSHRLIKAYYFLSPPTYCSIVYNIFTFNDKLYIAISSRSKLIPSAKTLSKLLRSQIELLHILLSRRRVPGESKRAKRSIMFADMPPSVMGDGTGSVAVGVDGSSTTGIDSSEYYAANQIDVTTGTTSDLTNKLHEVQDELNRLSEAYDMGEPGVAKRYEELKEEFTTLLYQMRRRKSIADYGNNIMINIENEDDDENDGELRPPPRRFSVVSIGRRGSIVSSLPTASSSTSSSRVTPPILSRRAIATSPEPPSSPEVAFKMETEC